MYDTASKTRAGKDQNSSSAKTEHSSLVKNRSDLKTLCHIYDIIASFVPRSKIGPHGLTKKIGFIRSRKGQHPDSDAREPCRQPIRNLPGPAHSDLAITPVTGTWQHEKRTRLFCLGGNAVPAGSDQSIRLGFGACARG